MHPYACHYPAKYYKEYYKFAFVRNPWDRLVSAWLDKVVNNNHFKFSEKKLLEMQKFENFVNFVASQDIYRCEPHIRLQSALIDLNNINYIGRFEHFTNDLQELIQNLSIDIPVIEKKNVSQGRKDYKDYYNDNLKEKVTHIYQKDINLFPYKFE